MKCKSWNEDLDQVKQLGIWFRRWRSARSVSLPVHASWNKDLVWQVTQHNENIISSFKILFDLAMLETIFLETNRLARRIKEYGLHRVGCLHWSARLARWSKPRRNSTRNLEERYWVRDLREDYVEDYVNKQVWIHAKIHAMLRFDNPLT